VSKYHLISLAQSGPHQSIGKITTFFHKSSKLQSAYSHPLESSLSHSNWTSLWGRERGLHFFITGCVLWELCQLELTVPIKIVCFHKSCGVLESTKNKRGESKPVYSQWQIWGRVRWGISGLLPASARCALHPSSPLPKHILTRIPQDMFGEDGRFISQCLNHTFPQPPMWGPWLHTSYCVVFYVFP